MGIFRSSKEKKEESFWDDPSTRKLDNRSVRPTEIPELSDEEESYDDESLVSSPPPPQTTPAPVTPEPPAPQAVKSAPEEPATRVLYRRRPGSDNKGPSTSPGKTPPKEEPEEESGPMNDPVVGWVVVVDGPGRGHALKLGYGMNSIGRGNTERIRLDFGDEDLSRSSHAIITYDPRGRKFYVQHGGGKNLTYLGDSPLLMPAELHGGEFITLGQTTLRFVPLCGEEFDWQTQKS